MGTKRTLEDDTEDAGYWRIHFQDANSIRNVLSSAAAIMPKVVLKVVKTGDAFYLRVEGCDSVHTCCIFSSLLIDEVVFADKSRNGCEFCMDCKHFLYSIDNPSSAHGTVTIEGNEESSHVQVTIRDPDCPSTLDTSRLATFLDTRNPWRRNLNSNLYWRWIWRSSRRPSEKHASFRRSTSESAYS